LRGQDREQVAANAWVNTRRLFRLTADS